MLRNIKSLIEFYVLNVTKRGKAKQVKAKQQFNPGVAENFNRISHAALFGVKAKAKEGEFYLKSKEPIVVAYRVKGQECPHCKQRFTIDVEIPESWIKLLPIIIKDGD